MVALKLNMHKFLLIWILLLGMGIHVRASHVMGGELTWEFQGGNYFFTLVFYRDCNGAEVNTVSETIRVWNHPTLSSITLPFISRTDISPTCTPVSGGPSQLSCGTGASGGNGIGAIEKIVYRSGPVVLNGTPPASGWVFTYENFSRSSALTNIANPSSYGITIAAKMYAIPGNTQTDSSPKFLQEPYFVSCTGEPYVYNMNPVDPDLDSLAISFGVPYNNFPSGTYNPPSNPTPVPFESGFTYSSPTPNASVSTGSFPAQINPVTGELTFTSTLSGNFAVKVLVRSFRYGVLIAEVEREMQLVVLACAGSNTKPLIAPPFAGGTSFSTTINAGDPVTFNLQSSDIELLQDGSPQQNILNASGPMFGTGFTSTTGCAIAPCATLSPAPTISGNQGVATVFNWQTTCDHLLGADGYALDAVPYNFVFRIQDNYCDVPKVSYATVTVNVLNPGVIQAPQISCIQSDQNGDVTLQWNSATDPGNTFVAYQMYSVQNGLLATLPGIGTTSWTDPAVLQQNNYYLAVVSGCNGNTLRYSDTLSNIFLDIINPSDGTAVLNWNDPLAEPTPGMNEYSHIYREYPAGTWSLIDSVPYGTNQYRDTITLCSAFLNYQIVLPNQPCDFISNTDGDTFEDMLTPYIPVISSVSIDTLSNELEISWNQNAAEDTYGYVIYTYDNGGFLIEIDTVWGNTLTSYSYLPDITQGPLSYTIAAFDSCYTTAVPPTFQTSAKAEVHTTMFLSQSLNICDKEVTLQWTPYEGWDDDVTYEIYGKTNSANYAVLGQTSNLEFTVSAEQLQEYCFFIKAISSDGTKFSFSNSVCLTVIAPTQPAFHYLKNVTVVGEKISLEHWIDASSGVTEISFERLNEDGAFEEIARVPVTSNTVNYLDSLVETSKFSYTYRARIIDSCGSLGVASNSAQSILLRIQKDEVKLLTYLDWNPYSVWDGSVVAYRIYRDTGTGYSNPPLALLPPTQFSFEDDLNAVQFNGNICYYVEALEGDNIYASPQLSASNEACELFEPIIYIPNAFTPEGINPIFRPILSLFTPENFQFSVFDRWGQIIFETEDPNSGWDGLIQGTNILAATGTYLYMVRLSDGQGNEIIRRGYVSLLK
ncbi:MAG: hypothetical protein RIT43_1817 [Bacteroidota bacterium]